MVEKVDKPEFLTGRGETAEMIRSFDWQSTSLSDPASWPLSLKAAVNLMLNIQSPMYIVWGSDFIQFYNDAFLAVIGRSGHPVIGRAAKETFSEVWTTIEALFHRVMEGEMIETVDFFLPLRRNGLAEESYFSISCSPVRGDDGEVAGVLVTTMDTSPTVNNQRRNRSLVAMANRAFGVKTEDEAWQQIRITLEENPIEFQFGICYSIDDEGTARLLSRVRFDKYPDLDPVNDLLLSSDDLLLRELYLDGRSKLERHPGRLFPREMATPSLVAHVPLYAMTVKLAGRESPIGAIIIGLNPEMPFDETYQAFCDLFVSHASAALSNGRSYHEDKVLTREPRRHSVPVEKQWRSMFLHAPMAIAIFRGKDHVVDLVNDRMLELWGKTYGQVIGKPVFEGVSESRGQGLEEMLNRSYELGERVTTDETLVTVNRNGRKESIFVKFILEPMREADGSISGVMTLTDEITFLVNERERVMDLATRYEKKATERTLSLRKASAELQRSEDRYQKMIEEVQDYAIIMLGIDGEVLNWNKGAEKIKGYREAEIIGKNFRVFYLLEDRQNEIPEKLIAEAKKNGKSSHYGWRLRKNGSKFWGNTVITALHDERQEVIGYTKVTRDLTEKKVADDILSLNSRLLEEKNAELIQQRDFRDSILESTIDIVLVYDRELRFLVFNRQAEIKYGVTKEHVLGKRLTEIFPQAKGSKGINDLYRAFGGEIVHNTQYRSAIVDLWYEDYLIPLRTPENDVYAVLVIAHDITESIQANEQLKEMNEELIRSNHDLEQFAYIASHDLQEPLRKIRTFSDILQRKLTNLPDQHRYYFKKIQQSAQRMADLINAVLNYSRLSNHAEHFQPVDLNEIIENVRIDYELLISEKKATIDCANLPVVRGISLQLNQLFANLVHNALKFTSVSPHIMITSGSTLGKEANEALDPETRYIELTFSDNGIGFDQRYADKIFTIFQRLHSREKYAGTGIGLALCKKIVDNHKGIILVQSKRNEGSKFIIYLPEEPAGTPQTAVD